MIQYPKRPGRYIISKFISSTTRVAMLHLPTELVLSIFRFLPLATLARLQTTSREWNTFFKVNHSSIYHNAAVLHGFIPSASTVYSELDTIVSRRALAGVVDWRSFCTALSTVFIEYSLMLHNRLCPDSHKKGLAWSGIE
jgi:hypothetical protein